MANKNKNVIIVLNHKSLHILRSQIPVYYFLANNSESCPELSGERLLTTVAEGESFEGLSVSLIRIEMIWDVIKMIMISIKIMMRMLRMMIKTTIRMMMMLLRYTCNVVAATHHSQWLSGGASQFHFACDISNYIKLYGWKRFERWKIF